jgi:rhodanese-related sulfurtransferase
MFLDATGLHRVANIAGGIDAWSQERDPAVPRY